MEEKQIEEIVGGINEKAAAIKEAVETKASKEDVELAKKEFAGELEKFEKAAKEQGAVISELKKSVAEKMASAKSFGDAIKEAWESHKEDIKSVVDGVKKGTGEIEIKADVTTASVQGSTASYRIPGIGQKPVRRVFIADLFATGTLGPDSGGTITYWDQDTLARNAANVAECGLIPESEINWQEYSCKVEKIADSIPVCSEALEDYSFIESEVRNFLMVNIDLKLDQQVLFGSGVSPQLKGIDGTAQTWAAGDFALMIEKPSIVDVILTGKTQIENSGQNNAYNPDLVLMNPTDFRKMKLEKDTDGNYLIPNYMTAEGTVIEGLRVLETPLVAQNTLYIMDSALGTVYNHRGMTLDVANQHADDFLHDRIRLRGTIRKSFVIRNVNANAFLKVTDIAAAQTALLKP